MLKLEGVCAGYDDTQVLHQVSLEVQSGRCVSLLGRNGMGKTTTVRVIMGQLPISSGRIVRMGDDTPNRESFAIARSGFGLVPEGRMVFGNLTVQEHLEAFARPINDTQNPSWSVEQVLDLFPRLRTRFYHTGNLLSGGEQQMLVIARALVTNPKLLILDEATEGLAPLVREQIWQILRDIQQYGMAILIIDKNIRAITEFAHWHYILEKGRVVWEGDSPMLQADPAIPVKYLGV